MSEKTKDYKNWSSFAMMLCHMASFIMKLKDNSFKIYVKYDQYGIDRIIITLKAFWKESCTWNVISKVYAFSKPEKFVNNGLWI